MRRVLVTVLVLVALLAVLDRVALWAAEHDVAERLQADAHLHGTPDVSIHGFPFLTQLVGGDYDDVDVVIHGLAAGSVRIDRLSVHLNGAHVSFSDVISQDRSRIHVDHASAELLITYSDLKTPRAAITGVTVIGADTIRVSAGGVTGSVKLSGLPFGIRLTSAKATQDGIRVSGAASGLVLRT